MKKRTAGGALLGLGCVLGVLASRRRPVSVAAGNVQVHAATVADAERLLATVTKMQQDLMRENMNLHVMASEPSPEYVQKLSDMVMERIRGMGPRVQ